MDKIQELKEKHYKIKEIIKARVKSGRDVKEKVKEYLEIVEQLRAEGIEVNDSSKRISEAIKQCAIPTSTTTQHPVKQVFEHRQVNPIHQPTPISTLPPEPEVSIYKITLAWTERPGHEPDNTLKIIENYLTENGARMVDKSSADFDEYKENMRSYEWEGDDKEFNILRKSANYILDVFAQNQYEKFNISIFGNKKR